MGELRTWVIGTTVRLEIRCTEAQLAQVEKDLETEIRCAMPGRLMGLPIEMQIRRNWITWKPEPKKKK